MPFVPMKQAFNTHIYEVVLGVGDKATAIGGQNVLPFHTFDAEIKNAPKIGVELTDLGMAEYTMPGEKAFYAGCTLDIQEGGDHSYQGFARRIPEILTQAGFDPALWADFDFSTL